MGEWKMTEIGKLPRHWEVGLFESDLRIQGRIGWKGYKTSDLVDFGPYVIGGSEIKSSIFLDLQNAQHLTREKYEESPEIMLRDGDVLLVTRGNLGEVGYYHGSYGEGTINPSVIILNDFKGDSKFLYYYLSSSQGKASVMSLASGSSVPAIYQADVKKLRFPKPPLEEQVEISEIVYSFDLKIDLLHRQNATLEKMAETLFRQWFVEEAKEEWENCVLEGLCSQINSGGTPSTKIESYYNGNINWYSTKELNDNFLFESNSKITEDGLYNSSAKLFPKGTVVIAIYAAPTVGRLGILGNEAAFNQAACGFVANDEICCKEFIYLFLKNQRDELNAMASGSAQQNLNVGKMKSYPAFIPDTLTMEKFKLTVIPMFERIENNTLKIRTLTALRDTLLPKLMSGEVRVEN